MRERERDLREDRERELRVIKKIIAQFDEPLFIPLLLINNLS